MAFQLAAAAASSATMAEGTVANAMMTQASMMASTMQAMFRTEADSVNAIAQGAVIIAREAGKVGNT